MRSRYTLVIKIIWISDAPTYSVGELFLRQFKTIVYYDSICNNIVAKQDLLFWRHEIGKACQEKWVIMLLGIDSWEFAGKIELEKI